MQFKVIAKRYGDSVEFFVDGTDVKAALQAAHGEANRVFGYEVGELGAPTVAVKSVVEEVN